MEQVAKELTRMKTAPQLSKRGVALVIVLSFLVIISVLTIAFFSSVATELQASRTYAAGVTTRQLAESATSVVMAQIREATARTNGAWASQPGMVRVYRDGGSVSEKADAFFKLYSSDNMIVTSDQISTFDPAGDVPVSGAGAWHKNPVLFTDLNEPMAAVIPGSAATVKRFPIMDPSAVGAVEGFGITADAGDPQGAARLARMPVRWIYVLQDGTLSAPSSADGTGQTATWTGARKPAKDNPIVGRIAFWTDDDTSKVNINTAAGFVSPTNAADQQKYAGSFWDTPRTYSSFDAGAVDTNTGVMTVPGLAACQPAQHEYQRYPGHPATTSLGMIFKNNLTTEQIYRLVPRVIGGGSQGGTVQPVKGSGALDLNSDNDRLYASVDELLYAPTMNGGLREKSADALKAAGAITPDLLEKTRFFLTAGSRAPELNLFGRPRLTIWPISSDTAKRTAFDGLFSFCSTIGGKGFYVSRNDPNSAKNDATAGRNPQLYAYLQELTGKGVPGFGTDSFKKKYGDDRDQILTEIFDYIRCINLKDSSLSTTANDSKYYFAPQGLVVPMQIGKGSGFGRFPTISEAALVFYHAGFNADKSKQLLRAFLVFETFNPMFGYSSISSPSTSDKNNNYVVTHEVTGLEKFKVKSPGMAGQTALGFLATATNTITTASVNTWHGRDMGGFEGIMHTMTGKIGAKPGDSNYYQFQSYVAPNGAGNPGVEIPAADTTFNFTGGEMKIKVKWANTDLQTITVKFPDSTGEWPLPKLDKGFWPLNKTTVPGADTYYADAGGFFKASDCNPPDAASFHTRLNWAQKSSYEAAADPGGIDHTNRWRQIIQPGDTVRSVEIAGDSGGTGSGGDMRIIAIQDAVDRYKEHNDYQSSTIRQAHSLHTALGPIYYGAKFGKLVKDAAYSGDKAPDVPSRVNGAVRKDGAPGDWDTGIGSYPDGSYPNKVDEGNTVFFYTRAGVPKGILPYFGTEQYQESGPTYFSPNRQVPSAVMFGSLPSRVIAQNPWETLLFCPNPAGANHRGMIEMPKDHLLLDLFHMPVVEPYAISEPFSTAGKVNLNYQLAPFSYITRTTALRAALHAVRLTAIPVGDASKYKSNTTNSYRYLVDRDETIKAFDDFFATYKADKNGGFFKSTSQVCERFLYPQGVAFASGEAAMRTFWTNNALTGDNVREKPYADLYPRLTTKSNTYTVHFRVQTLRQRPRAGGTDYAKWEEGKDAVLGEYRGSTTIERYVDPEDRRFDKTNPETASNGDFIDVDAESLEKAYRFRVVLNKKFTP